MALDPEIALAAKPTQGPGLQDWMNMAGTAQNISASQTQQAATQASIPGIQAEAGMEQRKLAGQQWIQANADKYRNEDGSVNSKGLFNDMAAAGYADQAAPIAAHWLDNQAKEIKNADDAFKFMTNAQATSANLASSFAPGTDQDTHVDGQRKFLNTLGNAPGTSVPLGDALVKSLYLKDKNGNPIMNPITGTPTVDSVAATGYKMASISPETQETIRAAQNANVDTPDANDPTKPISQNFQALAKKFGLPGSEEPNSAHYWSQRPDFKKAIENNVVPTDYKTANATQATQEINAVSTFRNAANDVAQAQIPAGTTVGAWMRNRASTIANDPMVRKVQSVVDTLKAENPSLNIEQVDGPSLIQQLQGLGQLHQTRAETFADNARSTQFTPSVDGKIPSAGNTSRPGMGAAPQIIPPGTPKAGGGVQPPVPAAPPASPMPASSARAAAPSQSPVPEVEQKKNKIPTAAEIQDYATRTHKTVEQVKSMLRAKGIEVQ